MPHVLRLIGVAGLCLAMAGLALAADIDEAQKLFRTGRYGECIEACDKAIASNQWGEAWWLLKIRSELVTGQYAEALKSYEAGLDRYDASIPLRLLGHEALRLNDRPGDAETILEIVKARAERAPWRYSDPANRVALGKVLLLGGADPRQVLELFFDKAKKDAPESVDAYLASAELALEKQDFALAAEEFANALKRSPDDADIHFGLARAFENDGDRATAALNKALELNPRHVESLLLQADNLIDREEYKPAEGLLEKVLAINPKHARAWAFRTVLAHLAGDRGKEETYRTQALGAWTTNPEVDHVLGTKLSQKYRFAEGAWYQRQALKFVEDYRPAKIQLAQDLLRLGKEDEGWRLADEVFKADQYNVLAYNLATLHDSISKFKTLENPHFIVRMDQREAEIYGQRVMRLLLRAKEKLSAIYGVELKEPVIVEIFPQQKDFAIRTFGLPGGAGFLGVCFGPVVTVNSPASRASHPSNWEAILWHEFCHTITLTKTRNKMPRWLSEGISVHEERREVSSWGQAMSPQYRELILKGQATPVSKLSGAFLKPPTPMHLQFAYYESSMVVDYVLSRFGAGALQNVLTDLGNDVPINDALAKHTEPIEKLDENFAAWLKKKAEELAPKADWKQPDLDLDAGSAEMAAWNKEHPNSFYGLLGEGRALISEKKYKEAMEPLNKAVELHPNYGEAGGPYLLLAAAHRGLSDAKAERAMLEKHLALDADAIEPRVRLMEIAAGEKDWKAVKREAEEVLGVNPLIPAPHRYLAQASEGLGERKVAIEAHRTLLLLDPLDRAEHHYQLARLHMEEKEMPEARRQVVRALEEAPRYRAAHGLLLEIAGKMEKPATRPATAPATPPAPKPQTEARPK
jgi:tetratricopeptide (TPR) repeat protein